MRAPANLLLALLTLVVAGCGVSRELYQDQVVRSQALEAQSAELHARLEDGRQETEELRAELEQCRLEIAELDGALGRLGDRGQDLKGQLESCLTREEELRADLDVSRKALRAAEEELQQQKADRDRAQAAWNAREQELQSRLEALRGEAGDLRARIQVLEEEKERVEREKREKIEEMSSTYEGLLAGMEEEIEQGRVIISRLRGQLSVNLLDEILFDSGSAVVKAEGQDILRRLGELLEEVDDKRIVIEGHTDDVPISGELAKRFPTNWELSAARAVSVVRYLDEVAGLDPARLMAAGYGKHRPAVPNDTPENRARNRRIEVKLVPLENPVVAPEPSEPAAVTPAEEGGKGPSPAEE